MMAPDFYGVPRKRTLAGLLLIGVAFGATVGEIDRARGAPSSADALFSEISAPLQTCGPGETAAAPVTSTAGAAVFIEARP